MLKQLIALLLIATFISCLKQKKENCTKKNQECSNARFTLMNQTQDTIYYGININFHDDSLLPGQIKEFIFGQVKITYDKKCNEKKESWSTQQLSSNWGEWAFHIDHCNKKSAFRYTDNSNAQIKLYDVTEN